MSRTPETRASVAAVDCSDKTALVTGSTSGIGREIALALGRLGAHVIVHGRDRERGEAVVAEFDSVEGTAEFHRADFASQDAVREFAATVRESVDNLGGLDLLFNNAGGYFRSATLTDDGIEYTFAVNHLAPFLLTHLLAPAMPEDGRIVTTSSGAHRQGSLDFDGLRSVDSYSGMGAYCRSKLANILFTRELARRVPQPANCFHPGFIPGSAFFRELPAPIRVPMSAASAIPGFGSSVESGAATALYLGVAPETADTTGAYFSGLSTETPTSEARDDDLAVRLWDISEKMTDVSADEKLAAPATH
jgi:NAD(P)-dependent dehydrogenase (short-subunit alcohol dehydrogenase family)